MNCKVNGPYVEVSLSRRNLESLLAKLDRPDPDRSHTLTRMAGEEDRRYVLTVIAEEDEAHYKGREAGYMGDDIEAKIASNREKARHEEATELLVRDWPEDD